MLMIFNLCSLMAFVFIPSDNADDSLPDERAIRAHIVSHTNNRLFTRSLISHGEKLFPVYEKILFDSKVTENETSYIFDILVFIKTDRSRFHKLAVVKLGDKNKWVRSSAVSLIGEIGNEKDVAPIAMLLYDSEYTIPFAAAKALAVIGDDRTLIAFDVWLNSDTRKKDDYLFRVVSGCRDDLKKRLEKTKK